MNNDVINFGSYWQKSDKNFGKQPIEWYIVAREDNDLLLLSKYALSGVYYGYKYSEDWKHSIAREWMSQFVEDAFDRYERSVLVLASEANIYGNTCNCFHYCVCACIHSMGLWEDKF